MNIFKKMKEAGDDFEFYPTTPEILQAIKEDMILKRGNYRFSKGEKKILDCGAGDGEALAFLAPEGYRYAIEKSATALSALPADVVVVGTDFHQQTLLDKEVDVIFCNPPYTEYREWVLKILNESVADEIYFVIPQRWEEDKEIQHAIERSGFKVNNLGDYDFLNARRAARAKVHVLSLTRPETSSDDAFNRWFRDHFQIGTPKDTVSEANVEKKSESEQRKEKIHEMIQSSSLIESLVTLYNEELAFLTTNYQKLASLDPDLLVSLDIDVVNASRGLKMKIQGLKNAYWNELFSNFNRITDKLTASTRSQMLSTLLKSTSVDFTYDNAHAVVLWAIKNANKYMDEQLENVLESLLRSMCVTSYKSNQKLFIHDNFRYNDLRKSSHYMLETRCIINTYIRDDLVSSYSKQLDYRAKDLLNDLMVIGTQLGFDTRNCKRPDSVHWAYGSTTPLCYEKDGIQHTLFEVKPFKNGNFHIKFSQKFMLKLNIELGRLNGWIHSKEQCAEEFGVDVSEVASLYEGYHITSNQAGFLLEHSQAA